MPTPLLPADWLTDPDPDLELLWLRLALSSVPRHGRLPLGPALAAPAWHVAAARPISRTAHRWLAMLAAGTLGSVVPRVQGAQAAGAPVAAAVRGGAPAVRGVEPAARGVAPAARGGAPAARGVALAARGGAPAALAYGGAPDVLALAPVTVRALDARTGEPVAGVQLRSGGRLLGETATDGRATVPRDAIRQDLACTRPGYRTTHVQIEPDRPIELVTMVPAEATQAPTPSSTATAHPAGRGRPPGPAKPAGVAYPHGSPRSAPVARASGSPKPAAVVHAKGSPKPAPVAHANHRRKRSSTVVPGRAGAGAHVDQGRGRRKVERPAATRRTVVVRRGDTLWGLAQRFWGRGDRWRMLWSANRDRLEAPQRLAVGQVLRVPLASAVVGAYRVRRGDTLWAIARRFLGAGRRWPALWALNRDRIRDPRRIYPGQRLRL